MPVRVKVRRSKRRKRGAKAPKRSWRGRLFLMLVLVAAVGFGWLTWPFWQLSIGLGADGPEPPSRLYGRAHVLSVGEALDSAQLGGELEGLGYSRVGRRTPLPGEFDRTATRLRTVLRAHPTVTGMAPEGGLEVGFQSGRIAELVWQGRRVQSAPLEPPLVASYLGPDRQERRPVKLERVPEHLIRSVLAAEDARFFEHPGLSMRGILRAALVNLRGREVRQGGSTLTQQLAKNLFLTHERTLVRKVREVLLALLLELRFDKREILEAYLNEIYWGSSGSVQIMGAGAASWAYFGKEVDRLDLCESATLAGMIRSPGGYSPTARPERSRERRNWVLARLVDLGWVEREAAETEAQRPPCSSPRNLGKRLAPYFADAMRAEAERRFGVDPKRERALVLLSTLDLADQKAADSAVAWGLEALEQGWEKGHEVKGPLQVALLSLEPGTGEIRAWIGGRDYGKSQFDRVTLARRQAGSAFKPVVYASAFEDRIAAPSTLLEDAPLTVKRAGRTWSPQNSDRTFRGWVTARHALEESLNVPTARLAMQVGLARVVDMARALGIESRLQAVPALALGAFEVSPLELASVYSVFAAGGMRVPVHGLSAVLDPEGNPLPGGALAEPVRALSPQANYLVVSTLQGVIERGTGASARIQGVTDLLAGKTGTTNGRRDSWFGGFSPDRASLVWVGYDDNSKTRLSGARAALPLWARFTWSVRPRDGYPVFRQPRGIATAAIDPLSGELATDDCPKVLTEVFLEGAVPTRVCHLHAGWSRDDAGAEGGKKRWRWLKRVFGRDKKKDSG